MGMFDNVKNDGGLTCSSCGKELVELQSKSGLCELQNLTIDELFAQKNINEDSIEVYGECGNEDCDNKRLQYFILRRPEPQPAYVIDKTGDFSEDLL